jgi:hypothetical protein
MSTASIAGYRIGEKMGDQMSRSWVRTGFDQLLQDCLNAVLITAISIFIEVEFFNIHTWEGAFFFASSLALALTALQQWLFEFSKDSLPWRRCRRISVCAVCRVLGCDFRSGTIFIRWFFERRTR